MKFIEYEFQWKLVPSKQTCLGFLKLVVKSSEILQYNESLAESTSFLKKLFSDIVTWS